MWFEVPLPFFLRDHVYGLGWERVAVGAMLAVSTDIHVRLGCVACMLDFTVEITSNMWRF
jgi:hypothetical protein